MCDDVSSMLMYDDDNVNLCIVLRLFVHFVWFQSAHFSLVTILLYGGTVCRFIVSCVQHDVSLASPFFIIIFVDVFLLCYIVV